MNLESIKYIKSDWSIPILTNLRIWGQKLFILGRDANTLVTLEQFKHLSSILGISSTVEMDGHPNIMVDVSKKSLSNFQIERTNSFEMGGLALNLRLHMYRMLTKINTIWLKFKSVLFFFGQEKTLISLGQCCQDTNLTLASLISLPDATFNVCVKQMESLQNSTGGQKRDKRDISLLSKLIGEGNEIVKIETTLSSAITNSNLNFKKIEVFDKQMKNSINILDGEIFNILKDEERLRSHLTEVDLRMLESQNKFEYIMVKLQHLLALESMIENSLLSEQIKTMERAAFHSNECSLDSCEIEIHREAKLDFILIHKKIVSLVPVSKYLISCAAVSQYKVSIWHNVLATQTSRDTYLVGSTLVTGNDLKNKSAANGELRTFLKKERLLGVFNIFGSSLQRLKSVEFLLNGQRVTYTTLDIIHLPEDYEVVYDDKKLVDLGWSEKVNNLGMIGSSSIASLIFQ